MRRELKIKAGDIELRGWLNDTNTAGQIYAVLPLDAVVNFWGEEIYFEIPVVAELENPEEIVNAGDIAFWPPGKALCIFFGKTPGSGDNGIKPVSPVTVVGQVEGNSDLFAEFLSRLKNGESIRVSAANG